MPQTLIIGFATERQLACVVAPVVASTFVRVTKPSLRSFGAVICCSLFWVTALGLWMLRTCQGDQFEPQPGNKNAEKVDGDISAEWPDLGEPATRLSNTYSDGGGNRFFTQYEPKRNHSILDCATSYLSAYGSQGCPIKFVSQRTTPSNRG